MDPGWGGGAGGAPEAGGGGILRGIGLIPGGGCRTGGAREATAGLLTVGDGISRCEESSKGLNELLSFVLLSKGVATAFITCHSAEKDGMARVGDEDVEFSIIIEVGIIVRDESSELVEVNKAHVVAEEGCLILSRVRCDESGGLIHVFWV